LTGPYGWLTQAGGKSPLPSRGSREATRGVLPELQPTPAVSNKQSIRKKRLKHRTACGFGLRQLSSRDSLMFEVHGADAVFNSFETIEI